METEKEIKARYKKAHDTLTKAFYSGKSGLSKEQFNIQHGQIWQDLDTELLNAGYRTEPTPPRNLALEIDELKERVNTIESLAK